MKPDRPILNERKGLLTTVDELKPLEFCRLPTRAPTYLNFNRWTSATVYHPFIPRV
jgi:hypothetical protein